MGGDKGPGGDRRRRPPGGGGVRRPDAPRRPARGDRATPGAWRCWTPSRSSTWPTTRPEACAARRTPPGAGGRGGPRRPGSAMVSAGNTGAAMASALLRMGRIRGVARPAIATVIPVPGAIPTVLLDGGANADCTPAWLVQFAQMGAVFAAGGSSSTSPGSALLSIGEEPSKGYGAGQGDPRPAGPSPASCAPRAGSSATSRAATSCPTGPTWSSPTGSPAMSCSRPSRAVPASHRHHAAGDDLHRRGQDGHQGAPARSCCPSRPSSTPSPTGVPCCWVSTACASSATARRRRAPSSTPSAGPGDGGRPTWWAHPRGGRPPPGGALWYPFPALEFTSAQSRKPVPSDGPGPPLRSVNGRACSHQSDIGLQWRARWTDRPSSP